MLAIIPARSGSTGISHKNIKEFVNKPLLAHTIIHAKESKLFNDIIVSTDSEEYAKIAREYGASVPFLRPSHLAGANVPTSQVTISLLHTLNTQGMHYDYFAVLQATSPLRTTEDLRLSYQLLLDKKADAIISVTTTSHPIEWGNILPDDLSMRDFISKLVRDKPRQSFPSQYVIHGTIFWANTQQYLTNQDVYAMNSYAYIMPPERSIDIDTPLDWTLAELLYRQIH